MYVALYTLTGPKLEPIETSKDVYPSEIYNITFNKTETSVN